MTEHTRRVSSCIRMVAVSAAVPLSFSTPVQVAKNRGLNNYLYYFGVLYNLITITTERAPKLDSNY